MAGKIMGLVPFPPIVWAGTGLQLASGLGSAAVSYARARKYMKVANEKLFMPEGIEGNHHEDDRNDGDDQVSRS